MHTTGYEVDYIAVGEEGKSGDAIAIRWGNLSLNAPRQEQRVVIIDGGYKASGEALVSLIKTHYNTSYVDAIFLTHADTDHASGLTVPLEELGVGYLFMHKPWDYASDIKKFIGLTQLSRTIEGKLEKSLKLATELEELANKKGVTVMEVFQGNTIFGGSIHILSPSIPYYHRLAAEICGALKPMTAAEELLNMFKQKISNVAEFIEDALHLQLLDDTATTSASNSSSMILLFTLAGRKLLFTGDAGIEALTHAADYADRANIRLDDLVFVDIPHHGSKRNVGNKILHRIKGTVAYVSAAKDGAPKHPAKMVTNAFRKHGSRVFSTCGNGLRLHYNAPNRAGWGPATEIPFYNQVDK